MGIGKQRDRGKERQWRRWIRLWRQSGLSVRAFCGQHELSEPSFYAWRRELRRRDAKATAKAIFVPVQVAQDGRPEDAAADGKATFELVLGQRVLRVPVDFDAAALRRLLAVLEEKPC